MKIKCGVVCYRDEAGEMTGRVKSITRDIPDSEYDSECGLTASEKAFADEAVKLFARMLESNPAAKEYLDTISKE